MEKILVTGADGFIGSHLVETLVRRGFKVRALVCYNSFNSWGWLDQSPADILANLEVVAGDVRDAPCVRDAVRGCDTVFHLAALIAIPFSYRAPGLYVDTNINGTLNVLQAVTELGVRRMVHTSTSEVYGTAQTVPIREDHPLAGQSPYAASKIGADQLAYSFFCSFGTPVCTVRPFNTYGPRQSARAVIPAIISQMAAGANKIRLGAVDTTRDFNFVADTVEGFLAAGNSEAGLGETFNIGSGFEISIRDVYQMIAGLMENRAEMETDADRIRPDRSEVQRLLADATKARTVLGWKPAVEGEAGLREGLRQTIAWFTEPSNLRNYKTLLYNT